MSAERTIVNDNQYELYRRCLENEYDAIKQIGTQKLLEGSISIPEISPVIDSRSSLDVYYVPPESLRTAVDTKVLQPATKLFREIKSRQVVYKPEWLHLSTFILFAAETPEEEKPLYDKIPDYYNAVAEALSTSEPVDIIFNRVIVSPAGIILGGMPKNLEIQKTRARLYPKLYENDLNYWYRRPPFIAHMTLSRWQSELTPEKAQKLLEFSENLDGQEIWAGTLDTVTLAIGTYAMDPERKITIDEFKLTKNQEG